MSNTVRKGEMSRRVAEVLSCTTANGEEALNAVLESITDALGAGDKVVLTGFGTFELTRIKARKVRPIRAPTEAD